MTEGWTRAEYMVELCLILGLKSVESVDLPFNSNARIFGSYSYVLAGSSTTFTFSSFGTNTSFCSYFCCSSIKSRLSAFSPPYFFSGATTAALLKFAQLALQVAVMFELAISTSSLALSIISVVLTTSYDVSVLGISTLGTSVVIRLRFLSRESLRSSIIFTTECLTCFISLMYSWPTPLS